MPKYMTDRQLAERRQTSVRTVWRHAEKGILPPPVKLSPGCSRWDSDEVEAHEAQRKAARSRRNGAPKTT